VPESQSEIPNATGLEATLRDLPRLGTLVKDRGYRQVWQFEHGGRAYYLKFYPKGGPRDRFRRFFRGSPALLEFKRLQAMQRANVPAPRAVAAMLGFNLNGRRGDVVILDAIEPSIQLDRQFSELELRGKPIPDHLKLAGQVTELVQHLGQAKLGHGDLHLGNFLKRDDQLFLLDGYAVRTSGMHLRDLLMLGHSVRRYATTTDLLRGWEVLGPGGSMPTRNTHSEFLWDRFLQGITKENRYFGRLEIGDHCGIYYKHNKYPHRWSVASQLNITGDDWRREWPAIVGRIESGNDADWQLIKRSRSGEVFATEIELGGRRLPVIVKHPRRRYWYRYLNEIGRGSRPRRAWRKAWNLIVRGLPTAWPLLVMERRTFGYVTDAIYICERVPGDTLAHVELDPMPEAQREMLFRRTGRILRQIEQHGFSHFDAKASNWIVFNDDRHGPTPVLIDVDGIRRRRWVALGIQRLLKSMHENPQYTPPDSLALCQGYAPYAPMGTVRQEAAPETATQS
jgi:tRNA A-37 threonylcarbamoyl transferase component Bud32